MPIDEDTRAFLLEMLKKFNAKSVHEMVELSHKTKPWSENYEVRMKNTIPMSDMEAESSRFTI